MLRGVTATPLALALFGAPTVTHEGSTSALPFERRGQLLAFLALKRTWVGRTELAALLWPEQETKLAFTNLRKALFRLQSLAWGAHVESQGSSLRFDVATDVSAFESALRENRIDAAIALRRGDLLAGFDDPANESWTSWLAFERERLRVAWRAAAQTYLSGDLPHGIAIDLAAQLLADDPLDEAALRIQMSWLARTGQVGVARHSYRDFVARLRDELDLEPSAELKALHDSLGASAVPAAAIAQPVAADASFVGRAVELRRVATLLAQDDCRLLCITGPGGMGKTRLARKIVGDAGPRFRDGAVFVPLDDVPSIGDVGRRLARELGIALAGRADPMIQVIDFLRDRRMLVVLDNFEHLTADAIVLDQLLASCPALKLLVTTRERLARPSEWLLPLEGLPCPDVEDRDLVEAFDAVRLFIQAAQRVTPGLATSAESEAIVDICRQVEGLPLALELAASWTRVLSCSEIASELRQSTELLRAVDIARPARHASMEVVFEQSWRLLSAAERDVLPRLTVFGGGFSATAARAVAGASLPVLGALADKSLLRKEPARIHLHPLVQQLAAARLDEAAGTSTRAAHAAYFHRLLSQHGPAIASGDKQALLAIDDEFENCRRAWRWSVQSADTESIGRAVLPMLDYCDARGRTQEALVLFSEALAAPWVEANPKLHALLLSRSAHLEYRLDRYVDAQASATRALAMSRRGAGDRATRRQALNVLGTCALRLGRLEDARRYFKQTLEETPPELIAHSTAVTLDHLALVEKGMGNLAEAQRLSLESLAQHRSLGDVAGVGLCLNNLGSLNIVLHDYEAAGTYLREALAISENAGIVANQSFIFANLVEVAIRTGRLDQADDYARRGLEVATGTGNRGVVAWMNINLASLRIRRGALDDARASLAEGLGLATTLGVITLKFEGLVCFAELLEAQGEAVGARQILMFAADHPAANVATRREIRGRLESLPPLATPVPPCPSLDLDELAHRIVAESRLAHAPLIAVLRAAG